MIVFETRKQRRLLVRLERGEELVATLTKLAKQEKIGSGWVRGTGTLAWAELCRHDQGRRRPEPPQRFETPCEVLSLEGSLARNGSEVAPQLFVGLSRRTDNGVELLGGQLTKAEVFSVELVVEHFEDVRLERTLESATGLGVWTGDSRPGVAASGAPSAPAPTAPAPTASAAPTQAWTRPSEDDEEDEDYEDDDDAPAPSGGVSWADVAKVSAAPDVAYEPPRRGARRSEPQPEPTPDFRPPPIPQSRKARADAMMNEVLPVKGDFIQHRQFGLCKIDKEDADGGLIIRLPSGVRKTIKLDFMEVGQPFDDGGRRVFPVRPRRR